MGKPFWSAPDSNDTDIDRDETVNGYRIVLFKSGGVRVTKDDYWAWSYPGDFEASKALAARLSPPPTETSQ